MRDYDSNLPVPLVQYEDYIQNIPDDGEYRKERIIQVCDELVALIDERARYNDKKIFGKSGNYYKPSDIVVTATRIRPQFLGLFHDADFHIAPNYRFKPLDAVELMAVLDSFVSNNINVERVYRRRVFSFKVVKRDDSIVLCIDYGEDLKKSYLDKCYCRITAGVLRTILSNCDYWL